MIVCCSIHSLYAQHPVKIEQELLAQLRKINYWAANNDSSRLVDSYDSLEQANKEFRNHLLRYTSTVHATIGYDFYELQKQGLTIKTSNDGLFRIYSWDTRTGGTAHVFDAVFQYRNGNRLFSTTVNREEGDPGRWYSIIHTLKTDNKTYYLAVYHVIESSRLLYQGVKTFCIEGDRLNDSVRLIKTATGIRNELGFEYDFLSVASRPERPVKLIYFDEDDDELHLSVVWQNGKVSNRFITYQFTGKYFEKVK